MKKITLSQKEFLKKHFLNIKKQKFIPGISSIPLAESPYDWEEVYEALDSLLSMKTTMGEKVNKFEKLFAKYVGTKYAIMVNSGSSANLLALSIFANPSLGSHQLKKGDEIITPAVTWATTVYPICNMGAIPVFVDVNLDTFEIDTEKIENAITKKTKAIMPVHLLGNPCNMTKIKKIAKKYGLWVIEDACEAHGSEHRGKKVGTFGNMGTFSFFLSHHITTMEGGMLVTNDKTLFELGKSIRTFGWSRDISNRNTIEKKHSDIDSRFLFLNMGYNFRPTELQGAFGIHQIKKLESFIKIKIDNLNYWNKKLKPYSKYLLLPKTKKSDRVSPLFYPLTIIENNFFTKNELVMYLEKRNIETRPIMTGNFVKQPVTKSLNFKKKGNLDNASYIMKNSFCIGNHQGIDKIKRKFIVETIIDFLDKKLY
jgi:CDP-6-deoxy-D-xylo-4-hexulose-3-dehydrase